MYIYIYIYILAGHCVNISSNKHTHHLHYMFKDLSVKGLLQQAHHFETITDFVQAKKAYKKAFELYPNDHDVLCGFGQHLLVSMSKINRDEAISMLWTAANQNHARSMALLVSNLHKTDIGYKDKKKLAEALYLKDKIWGCELGKSLLDEFEERNNKNYDSQEYKSILIPLQESSAAGARRARLILAQHTLNIDSKKGMQMLEDLKKTAKAADERREVESVIAGEYFKGLHVKQDLEKVLEFCFSLQSAQNYYVAGLILEHKKDRKRAFEAYIQGHRKDESMLGIHAALKRFNGGSAEDPIIIKEESAKVDATRAIDDCLHLKKRRRRDVCAYCMTKKPTHVSTTCGHRCLCGTCASVLKKCPLCNKVAAAFIRVYS